MFLKKSAASNITAPKNAKAIQERAEAIAAELRKNGLALK